MDSYTELLVKRNEEIGIICNSCRNVFFVNAEKVFGQHASVIICPDCRKAVSQNTVDKYAAVAIKRMKVLFTSGGNIMMPLCIYPPELN